MESKGNAVDKSAGTAVAAAPRIPVVNGSGDDDEVLGCADDVDSRDDEQDAAPLDVHGLVLDSDAELEVGMKNSKRLLCLHCFQNKKTF